MRLRIAYVFLALVLAIAAPLSAQERIPPARQTLSFAQSVDLLGLPTLSATESARVPLRTDFGPIELIPRLSNSGQVSLQRAGLNPIWIGSGGCTSLSFPPSVKSRMSSGSCERKPLSPGGKFGLAMKKIFYPLPLLWSAAGAGISQARNSDPGFGQGAKGYGRRFGDRVGTRGIKEISGTFLIASAFKMDPQYHPSTRRGFGPRLGSVLSQVFVSRTDSGRRTFNFPSVFGAAIGVGVSNVWRADRDRKASDSALRFGLTFAFDAASNFFSEFFLCRKHPRN